MTLVLSCISPNHVVQVSDRRLTWLDRSGAVKVADDNSNKALVICNRLVLGYTGLARVEGQKTDEWALDVAAEVTEYNPQRVSEALAKRASEVFRKTRLGRDVLRHAFLVSGWAKFNSRDAPFTPFVSAIANALDDRWHWLSEAEDEFKIRPVSLAGRPFLLAAVGQRLSVGVLKRLIRGVRAYAKRESGPEPYIRMLNQRSRSRGAKLGNLYKMGTSMPRNTTNAFMARMPHAHYPRPVAIGKEAISYLHPA